jgi:anthranilate synthase/aminodeoxychorismate synthase-like glutamine amidotransferase
MILLIDNYDSFSYNLYQLIGTISREIKVIRNDELTLDEIKALAPSHIILSPGPGYPKSAGICEQVAYRLGGEIPILGVCLGHQAICEAYGGTIAHAKHLMHGKKSKVSIDSESPIFLGLPKQIDAARYHSLIAKGDTLPKCLKVIGEDEEGEVMAVAHETDPIYGLQFHPESILTPLGKTIIQNFLKIGGYKNDDHTGN